MAWKEKQWQKLLQPSFGLFHHFLLARPEATRIFLAFSLLCRPSEGCGSLGVLGRGDAFTSPGAIDWLKYSNCGAFSNVLITPRAASTQLLFRPILYIIYSINISI